MSRREWALTIALAVALAFGLGHATIAAGLPATKPATVQVVRDVVIQPGATCNSDGFDGSCEAGKVHLGKQPISMSYMCREGDGSWTAPSLVDIHTADCLGDELVYDGGNLYMLHTANVPITVAHHLRYEAVFPAH